MAQFLVALALCYVLIKIPFWILGSLRGGGGRSLVGGLIRGLIAYKTFGLLGGGGGGGKAGRSRGGAPADAAAADPYARTRADSSGQYMLPLQGMQRGRLPTPPHQRYAPRPNKKARTGSSPRGTQQALFSTDGEPKSTALPPQLGPGAVRQTASPGEQTMLPIHARHDPERTGRRPLADEPPTTASTPDGQPGLFSASGRVRPEATPPRPGQRGALPATVRPGEQYPLPLVGRFTSHPEVRTGRRPVDEPPERPVGTQRVPGQQPLLRPDGSVHPGAKARPPSRPAPPRLPSVYKGIRPDKHGQYPLPTMPKPPPRRRAVDSEPPSPPAHDPHQQSLPLNLPKPQPPRDNSGKQGGDHR